MKYLFLFCLFTFSLFAYEKGDIIDKNLSDTLELKKDKVYVIDFFASWCGSCKKELPLITNVEKAIDKSKIEIIGIDVDKKLHKALAFQKKLKSAGHLNFRVINDTDNDIVKKFNPIGMPSLYYVKNGEIIDVIIGAVDAIDEKILEDLKKIK